MSPAAHRAAIALGANLGERDQAIYAAIRLLQAHTEIDCMQVSGLYRTQPVDAQGPDFCNATATFQTTLSPQALLALLLDIEQQLGRRRSIRNAPRTIDLDLIAFDAQVLAFESLTLPHPRAHERAFVLIPLCEIDGTVLLGPGNRQLLKPASQWLSALDPAKRQEVMPW